MSRALVLAFIAVALVAPADASRWVGSETCGSCHPTQLAAWKKTPHASAADRLGASPRARCLACHGTGDAPAGKAAAREVGCEACHGSGGDYAADDLMRDLPLARALGLRDLSTPEARAAMCGTCHRGAGTRLTAPALDVTPETVH